MQIQIDRTTDLPTHRKTESDAKVEPREIGKKRKRGRVIKRGKRRGELYGTRERERQTDRQINKHKEKNTE